MHPVETSTRSGRRRSYPLLDPGALAVAALVVGFAAPARLWVGMAPITERGAPKGFEQAVLAAAALITLTLPLIQIVVHIRAFGGSMIRGNRDDYPETKGFAARIARAHANAVEALVPFAAALLAATALGVSNRWTVAAAALFLVARSVHAVSYGAGVTVLRSAAFYAGAIATMVIAAQALAAVF